MGSLTIDTVPITSASTLMMFSGPGGLSPNTGTNYLNVAGNTFGSVQIWQSGLLVVGAENALPTNGSLYIGDTSFLTRGTLDLNGFSQTVGNLFSGTNFMASFVTNRSATPAILTINHTANTNYLGVLAGNMGFVKRGGGSLIMAGSNSYTLGTTVAGGTLHVTNEYALGAPGDGAALGGLILTNGGGLRTSGSFTLANRAVSIGAGGGFFTTDAGSALTITNPVTGVGVITKNSPGTLTLAGATTVSNVLVNDGRLINAGAMTLIPTNDFGLRILGSSVVSNSGSISVAPGKIQLYTNGRLDNRGLITNSTGFVLSEAGTAGLTVVNNLPGGAIQMNGGTMYIGLYYPGTLNNEGGDVTLAGATTVLVGGPNWATIVGSNTLGTLNIAGGMFNHASSGSFVVGPGGIASPNGTGIVNLVGGVLAVNKGITKGTGPDAYGFLNFNGGTLSGTVNNVTLLGTDLSAVRIQAGGGTVALAAGITNTITASLQNGGGGGGLTKDGAGVLRLTGASLHTGTTRVMGGVLDLVGSASLDNSSTLQIDTGATLMASNLVATLHLKTGQTLKGNGTFVGGLIVDSGSTVAPGASAGILTVAGNLTLAGGSTLSLELNGTTAGTQYDRLALSGGSLTLVSPTLDIVLGFTPAYNDTFLIVTGLSGFNPGVNGIFSGKADGSTFMVDSTEFQIDYNPADITLTVIPEPMTTGLAGFVVLAGWLLRRRVRG